MLDMLIDITKYLDKLNEETIEEKIIKKIEAVTIELYIFNKK